MNRSRYILWVLRLGDVRDPMKSIRSHAHKQVRARANFFPILIQVKLVAIELAATIVFFVWLYRVFMHEIGW